MQFFLCRCLLISFVAASSFCTGLYAQETNSRASGKIVSETELSLAGTTITLIHEPTQNNYQYIAKSDGYFHFANLKPGGPYTIIISAIGYKTFKMEGLQIRLAGEHLLLGNEQITAFILKKDVVELPELVLNAPATNRSKTGMETNISRATMQKMPTINRSLQDFIRIVPQARTTADGGISLAGQNNRFNAFFIDGANNTDIQGLSVNGMNGGQTGSPPVSIESIEEINVMQSPYHVQYGNFTGGSINVVTRSGTNENMSSAWYYFRNEKLAGRAPQPLERPGVPGEFYRPQLTDFFNQTFGLWNSGAIIKNKLFYFVLLEKQSELWPQPFNTAEYRGNSDQQQLFELSDFVNGQYNYDPGSFLETIDQLDATRINIKFDYNASVKNKFMLNYRYNNANRSFPPRTSGNSSIVFSNGSVSIPAVTHAATLEWKHFFKGNISNRILLSFTSQKDDRNRLGEAFPLVNITDGPGNQITLGSESNSGLYNLQAGNFALLNVFRYIRKKHILTAGADLEYSTLNNRYVPQYFGIYNFRSVNEFMNQARPSRLQRTYPFSEETGDPTKFNTLRSSFFLHDEIKYNSKLTFNAGVRLDINSVPSNPIEDRFFNDSAISKISNYHTLNGAISGQMMKSHWAISPRISIDYQFPKHGIILRAGAGIFTGHMINLWISDIFNSINGSIDILNPEKFIADPYGQPTAETLNLNPEDYRGALNLVSENFKFPSVFRTSATAEKKWKNGWIFSIEGIYTRNIHDVAFRNVNIMPPIGRTVLPDSRNVYSTSTAPTRIPLRSSGVNPYSQVYLVTNNDGAKGHSYSVSFIIQKHLGNFSFNSSYTFGRSELLSEVTGPQTPIASQWRNIETVNGRNFAGISISDNDLRHRIVSWVSYKIGYAKGKTATTLSLFYNGQSGSPFSYVYANSIVNDLNSRENFDLIYIPTDADLRAMSFSPYTLNGINYTAQEQKDMLVSFINSDKYLRTHRGQFSERNGARLPFTHTIDLHVQQDILINTRRKVLTLTLTYDVFNFTNMLNNDWGLAYTNNGSYSLINFAGYASTSPLTPQYQFRPTEGKPYSLQTSTVPGNSARWISQLGIKIGIN